MLLTIHMSDAECQKSTSSPCQCRARKQRSDSQSQLFLRVEESQVGDQTRKQATLESPQQYPTDQHAGKILRYAGQGGYDAPAHGNESDPP